MTAGVGEVRLVGPSLTVGGSALKARGCPPICCANRFPPRPLRGAGQSPTALTAAPPTASSMLSSTKRTASEEEQIMAMVHSIIGTDRVMAKLIAGLEIEFGGGAAAALADRFLAAETLDFHWDARMSERWLGSYEGLDDDDIELDRIAIFGRLDGRWFAAICIVDGDGAVHGMTARRIVRSETTARKAWSDAR